MSAKIKAILLSIYSLSIIIHGSVTFKYIFAGVEGLARGFLNCVLRPVIILILGVVIKLRLHYQSFLGQSPSKKTWSKFSWTSSTVYTIKELVQEITENALKSSKYVKL